MHHNTDLITQAKKRGRALMLMRDVDMRNEKGTKVIRSTITVIERCALTLAKAQYKCDSVRVILFAIPSEKILSV